MQKTSRSPLWLASIMAAIFLGGCVHSPPSNPYDPLEKVNRFDFKVNQKVDKYALRPVAKGYNKVVPGRVQKSVSNFFNNAGQPVTMVNSLLQLKWGKFNQSLGRFMINTVAGVGGLFDVASKLNVPHPDEDLGQTLGYWGLGPGPYLYLPLLGPSDGRDLIGSVSDMFISPLTYLNQIDGLDSSYNWLPYGLRGLQGVNLRASLLGFEKTLSQQFDPYAFVRSYYLEKRQNEVFDGHVPKKYRESDSSSEQLPQIGTKGGHIGGM